MQIGSYTPRFSMPLEARSGAATTAGTAKAPAREDFSSHFSSPDDIKSGYDSCGTHYYQIPDSISRLTGQWTRWREQLDGDPDAYLPVSTGWTEENIEYLKNRYSSDELTWVEREDALHTMKKLGMISGPQSLSAHTQSLPMLNLKTEADFQELLRRVRGNSSPAERDWNVLFKDAPIAGFSSIDDVLNWAKDLPDEGYDPLRCRIDASMVGVAKSK